jgi:hypothetical protein
VAAITRERIFRLTIYFAYLKLLKIYATFEIKRLLLIYRVSYHLVASVVLECFTLDPGFAGSNPAEAMDV